MPATSSEQYTYQTSKVIRGRESKKIAEMENLGWEVTQQTTGKVRSEITFRRVKKPVPWKLGAAFVVVGIAIFGILAALGVDDDDTSDEALDEPTTSVATTNPNVDSTATAQPTPPESEIPSGTPIPTPPEERSDTPTATQPPTPTVPTQPPGAPADGTLTTKNSPDLKSLLTADDNYELNRAFATNYQGRTIEFDGSIADAAPGFYLAYFGDNNDTRGTSGPAFQFRVGSLQTPNGPVATGDNLRIVASIGTFNANQGLFFLTPVRITQR